MVLIIKKECSANGLVVKSHLGTMMKSYDVDE
jgi:hypothetical protein